MRFFFGNISTIVWRVFKRFLKWFILFTVAATFYQSIDPFSLSGIKAFLYQWTPPIFGLVFLPLFTFFSIKGIIEDVKTEYNYRRKIADFANNENQE